MTRLSVIILTLNEEKNLGSCLESLEGLDCEIFIVDSGSTDSTVQIATAYGARVTAHHFENYGAQRNWAQENLPLSAEWVLHLDADERLTPELVQEINGALLGTADAVDGFLLRKRTIFMGRWIRYGGHYPSYHLRLFRRARGVCEDRLYDQHFVVGGPVKSLRHDYIDIVASDVFTWTVRHAKWAGLEAAELAGRGSGGRQISPAYWRGPIERRRWLRDRLYGRAPLFVRAFFYWFYRYFIRLGFLDGKPGLIFHFLQGCWFRFLVDATLYEAHRAAAEEPAESASGARAAPGRLSPPW